MGEARPTNPSCQEQETLHFIGGETSLATVSHSTPRGLSGTMAGGKGWGRGGGVVVGVGGLNSSLFPSGREYA